MCDLHDRDELEQMDPTITGLVDEIVVALTNARIYAPGHPRVAGSLDALHAMIGRLTEDRPALVVGTADGYLFHDGRPLLGASLSAGRVIDALVRLESGGIEIRAGIERDEILPLVDVLGAGDKGPSSHADANRCLAQAGCRKARLLPEYGGGGAEIDALAAALGRALPKSDGATPKPVPAESTHQTIDPVAVSRLVEQLRLPRKAYQRLVDGMQELTVQATRGLSVNLETTQGMVESVLGELTRDPKNMMGICRYERYDAFTFGHSIRVCSLALHFGRHLTTDAEFLERIGTAALLHDVGKARVPAEILFARGRLTTEERAEMDRHAMYGADILLDANQSDPIAVAAAFGHHMRHEDEARTGPGPSAVTRIVKICDVFEALTAVRPYKDRMPPARAYRVMFGMDGHFDPALLRRFVEVTGLFPVGSQVRLANGELARVHTQTDDLERPIVDIDESPFREKGERIDLREGDVDNGEVVEALDDEVGLDAA